MTCHLPLRLLTSLLLLAAGAALAQSPAPATYREADLALAKKAMAAAHASDLAYELVASLTTEVGPRPAGSANDAKAVAWAVRKLKDLGFDRVWTEPVTINAWERGPIKAEILAPYPQALAVTALGNSMSTPAKGVTADLAYYESLDALKADTSTRAQGRIVFIDSRFTATRDGAGYGQNVAARSKGASEAAKRGAVAVLIRSIGSDRDRLPHTGAMNYEDKVARIPAAAVSNPDADLIVRQVKGGQAVKVSLSMSNRAQQGKTTHNVMAELRGAELPQEIVAIGGHLDSWDLGTGAIDDGAGVAIAMAAAKHVKDLGVRPKRTLRVILFGNEENGLDGGKAYFAKYGKEPHQLIAEADAGADAIYRMNTRGDEATLPWMKAIAAVIAPLGIELGNNEAGAGADFSPLLKALNPPGIAMAQDMTRYFDLHHTANDTLDKIDPKQLQQNVAAWSAMVWLAAQADVRFASPPKKN